MKVEIYQDGKISRNSVGLLIGRRAGGVLIEFTVEEYDAEMDDYVDVTTSHWFTRRRRCSGGAYECIGWNYWYYPKLKVS